MTDRITIKVSNFTTTPGARYYEDGEYSGQWFRDEYLKPAFINNPTSEILVDLDGTEGYATSFLEEAFGGLIRLKDPAINTDRLKLVSKENPYIINEIEEYIEEAKNEI